MEELRIIQGGLKAPKGQKNKFGNYNYRSCEDILTALKPLLAKNKCFIIINDDLVDLGGRIYVKATVTITNSKGLNVTTHAFAREPEIKKGMDVAQITGSSSSYARKYALSGMFLIDDNKDADSTNSGKNDESEEAKTSKQEMRSKHQPIQVIQHNSYNTQHQSLSVTREGVTVNTNKPMDQKQKPSKPKPFLIENSEQYHKVAKYLLENDKATILDVESKYQLTEKMKSHLLNLQVKNQLDK